MSPTIPTTLLPATLPISTRPLSAVRTPPSMSISPPTSDSVSPVGTWRPTGGNPATGGCSKERLVIAPGSGPNTSPRGAVTVNREGLSSGSTLNCPSSPKLMLLAVVAKKEPLTLKAEFWPKIIPAGLIKNRLAASVLIRPSILEKFPPVTRLKIFSMFGALADSRKFASPPEGIENFAKLWNRFTP